MLIDGGGKKRVLEQEGMGLRGRSLEWLGSQEVECFLASGPWLRSRESGMDRTKNSFCLWEPCRRTNMKVSQVLKEM